MPYLLLGLLLLILVALAARGGSWGAQTAKSARAMRSMRRAFGTLALVVAGLALLRGALNIAMPLGALAGFLLFGGGRGLFPGGGGSGGASGGAGRASEVQTDTLEMQLDIDSGAMRGRVRRGAFAGRDLETLTPAEVAGIWHMCRFDDPQSAQLLEAYLDAIHPTWREDVNRADGGEAGTDGRGAGSPSARQMTRTEALDVLGLDETATADDVRRAHRALMREHHPDRGGETAMAAKLNEAKDQLLEDG